jgi:hypothetical protein
LSHRPCSPLRIRNPLQRGPCDSEKRSTDPNIEVRETVRHDGRSRGANWA